MLGDAEPLVQETMEEIETEGELRKKIVRKTTYQLDEVCKYSICIMFERKLAALRET